jgi:hypothetical protein
MWGVKTKMRKLYRRNVPILIQNIFTYNALQNFKAVFQLIRGIREDNIEEFAPFFELIQRISDIGHNHLGALGEVRLTEVSRDNLGHWRPPFHEDCRRRAATEGFYAYRPAARIEVEEAAVCDAVPDDVEQPLFRPGATARNLQPASFGNARYHPHAHCLLP